MENIETPMTKSLPVSIPSAPSIIERVSNENFLQDVVTGNEGVKGSEVSEETFNTAESEENILDSVETGLKEEGLEDFKIVEGEEDFKEVPLAEQISILEEKMVDLEDINRQLTERVTNLEMKNQVSNEALLKLLLMLQLLAEEEEQGEKTGMLEVLINFLVFFMKEAFIPKDENEKTQKIEKVEPKMKTHPRRVSEILELLKNESAPHSSKSPHIEKMAA